VAGVVHRLEDDLLREGVELLDLLAVHVLLAGAPRTSMRPAMLTSREMILAASAMS